MKGRKPKPTSLKLLTGNPGKRPLNANEPKPPVEVPECPEHLDAGAKAEWFRIAHELLPLGLLTKLDRTALAGYCQAFSRWAEAERRVQENGLIIKAPNGYPLVNPFLSIANKSLEQLKAFASEFGMTPSSRTRISVNVAGAEADDELDAFITKRA